LFRPPAAGAGRLGPPIRSAIGREVQRGDRPALLGYRTPPSYLTICAALLSPLRIGPCRRHLYRRCSRRPERFRGRLADHRWLCGQSDNGGGPFDHLRGLHGVAAADEDGDVGGPVTAAAIVPSTATPPAFPLAPPNPPDGT
jgi:hypothetical protein